MTDTQQALTEDQWRNAKLIWDYHQMHHQLRVCDVAIGLGSHDLRVAAFTAGLYLQGLVPAIVFTGGNSPNSAARFPRGEAVHFREHAIDLGVPADAVLIEPDAANTGQNIAFTRDVLAAAGITPASVLLTAMPYMERRAFATCRKVWPEVEVVCASEPLAFDDYLTALGDEVFVTNMLVGDMQRVIEYPRLGFAVEQDVPEDVHAAYRALIHDGFTTRLLT
ncbi:YdcF family protein [Streptomyces sp. NPDC018019]|uniref:YdcF family protein n=1 Tax=Streptomyces sp. NPDC018019 TaxID=3365030 RepID=UPI0037A38D47